ncbi:MAG: DUF3748 domain-containing protein [Tepidisphaeraceae bacterium]
MLLAGCAAASSSTRPAQPRDRQVTFGEYGHILTNVNVWSPDSKWIAYDVRSDPGGDRFDGDRIERVNVETGVVQVLYRASANAKVGVVTCSPTSEKVVFIEGPKHPTPDWSYAANHRQGVIVDAARPGIETNLDARDLTAPFTPGALRGGTHVHVFSPDGRWVRFTYEDAILPSAGAIPADSDVNARNIGVSVPAGPVRVAGDNPHNHDGDFFSVLVTHTVRDPKPGSDEISRACEEGWVGVNGYVRPDGTRQKRAIAFQGSVKTVQGESIAEVFIVDLPDDLTRPGDGPLAGTATRLPAPPAGVIQRRLTYTADRKYPGIQGPRHWLQASPDGSRIAFLMKDDTGIIQLWTISSNGGKPTQVTHDPWSIASAFTWNPKEWAVAYIADKSVFTVDMRTGVSRRLTEPTNDADAPRPLACVYSPDGRKIAYLRPVQLNGKTWNQVYVVATPDKN